MGREKLDSQMEVYGICGRSKGGLCCGGLLLGCSGIQLQVLEVTKNVIHVESTISYLCSISSLLFIGSLVSVNGKRFEMC